MRKGMNGVQVTGRGMRSLAVLTGLVKLELVSSHVFEAGDLSVLSNMSYLRHLDIGNVKYITKDILQVICC